jgi:hypothetical protein
MVPVHRSVLVDCSGSATVAAGSGLPASARRAAVLRPRQQEERTFTRALTAGGEGSVIEDLAEAVQRATMGDLGRSGDEQSEAPRRGGSQSGTTTSPRAHDRRPRASRSSPRSARTSRGQLHASSGCLTTVDTHRGERGGACHEPGPVGGTDRETITGALLQCWGERPYQGDLPVPISIGDARVSDRIVASL